MVDRYIYVPGETRIKARSVDGRNPYSGQTDVELLAEYPGSVLLTWDEVYPQITAAQESKYLGPVSEISRDVHDYALNVLPPNDWDGTHFSMSEMLTDNITSHYGVQQGRYFHQTRRRGNMREFKELIAEYIVDNPTTPNFDDDGE